MTAAEILAELETLGSATTKRTLMRHGAREPIFGVNIEHLKKIEKRIKHDHALALELYATGNSDAMYLAGLISEPMTMTKAQLNTWVKGAYWYMLSCFTVPWTASEGRYGRELALTWMNSKSEQIAAAGWATYSSWVSITPDDALDFEEVLRLLARIEKQIATATNRVKFTMNNFVISVACSVEPLLVPAKATAEAIGVVEVDVGDTSCQVPVATASIAKLETRGKLGTKRKTAFC